MKKDHSITKRILILSSFPAPYRVEVFKGLNKKYITDIFFNCNMDQNRNEGWFISKKEIDYHLLNDKNDRAYFISCIRNIKNYSLVLGYDWYLPFALKVELKCILYKIPYILNCDGGFIPNKKSFKDYIKAFFIKRAYACFAGGENASNYFKFYGALTQNIYIHHFSSLHEKDILKNENLLEKKRLRHLLQINDRKMVLSVGQFIYRKGFDILLKAWSELDKDYNLIIIGGGQEREQYTSIINEFNYKNVTILDFMSKDEVFNYFKAADLFVLPTREDIWGLVINEAMAAGLPVVTSNRCIAGLELIEHGVNGYLFPNEDINELSKYIKRAFDGDDLNNVFTENTTKVSKYTIENVLVSHEKVIDSLL